MPNQHDWRRRLLTAIVLLVVLGSVSCSGVIRTKIPRAEISKNGWVEGKYCDAYVFTMIKSYWFQHENVTLSICPKFAGGRVIFCGPPYLPIIPNFFALSTSESDKRERFKVTIRIQSPNNVSIINLSKIRIRLPEKEPLQPSDAKKIKKESSLPIKPLIEGSPEEITITLEDAGYVLTYDVSIIEVRELVIDIGDLQIDGKTIEVPELRYKKDAQYRYVPIYFD